MTQLNLAEKTGLSEAAVRSYELGTRNPRTRIASGSVNSHFDWDKAKMDPERMEKELAKLPSESDRKAIRSALENRERSEKE